jgi:hypothetical protein
MCFHVNIEWAEREKIALILVSQKSLKARGDAEFYRGILKHKLIGRLSNTKYLINVSACLFE